MLLRHCATRYDAAALRAPTSGTTLRVVVTNRFDPSDAIVGAPVKYPVDAHAIEVCRFCSAKLTAARRLDPKGHRFRGASRYEPPTAYASETVTAYATSASRLCR